LKCAIYVRVSTEEQAREGYSIEAQKHELTEYANSQNWTIHGLFIDDGYSAKDMKRPEFKRMMSQLLDIDVLLIYKLDRLSRSLSDLEYIVDTLNKFNVAFKSLKEDFETVTASGKMMFRIFGVFAQYERENLSERVRFGMSQMIREGKRAGSTTPYGYNPDGTLIPEESDVIRKIFKLYQSGKGTRAISIILKNEQILRRGKDWSSKIVQYTLDNPIYYGILRFGKKNPAGHYNVNLAKMDDDDFIFSESPWEKIFNVEDYEQHKKNRVQRAKEGYKDRIDYWFSGCIYCGKCGKKMYGKFSSVKSLYYMCSSRSVDNSCTSPLIRQIQVEHLFLEHLKSIVIKKEGILSKSTSTKKSENQIMIKQGLEKIELKRKKLLDIYLAEEITRSLFTEKKNEIDLEEKELLLQVEEPTKEIDIPLITNLIEIWNELSDRDKKRVVNNAVEKITVHSEDNPRGNRFTPFFKSEIFVEWK
jgi:site-specific DNA recombinase